MKKYRFVYWFNSCTTDCYVSAESEEEAISKFKERKGDKNIISIELVK